MFKKRSKSSKGTRRPRTDEEDDDDSDEGVADTLQTVKKRRTLLTTLQYKRGTDAAQLLHSTKEKQQQTVDKTTATESLPANTKRSEQQVWKERHAAALESYIQEQMAKKKGDEESTTNNDANKKKSHKDELYQQLAVTAAELSGKSNDPTMTTSVPTTEVVRSGAATAMAEVILPSASSFAPRRKKATPTPVPPPQNDNDDDDGRLGFAAARGQPSALSASSGKRQSSDDRAFSNFVQRQRRN